MNPPKEIELLREALQYDADTGEFKWRIRGGGTAQPGARAGSTSAKGYVKIQWKERAVKARRLAWWMHYGVWPSACIDHINGVRDDNRIANLRLATKAQNAQNIRLPRKDNKCGYLGVYARGGRWRAEIQAEGRTVYLGVFDTPQEAHDAYLQAKQRCHPFQTLKENNK